MRGHNVSIIQGSSQIRRADLSKKLKCNSSGCSFPGSHCNSQEITISIGLLIQMAFTVTVSQSACLLCKEIWDDWHGWNHKFCLILFFFISWYLRNFTLVIPFSSANTKLEKGFIHLYLNMEMMVDWKKMINHKHCSICILFLRNSQQNILLYNISDCWIKQYIWIFSIGLKI